MKVNDWVNRAVEKIRFAPDREAVRAELQAHLEDRREALEARGMTAEEAESAAAQAMGDPAEVAEALARIHRPWWGYLWRTGQWILAAVIVVSLFTSVPAIYNTVWNGLRNMDNALRLSARAGDVIYDSEEEGIKGYITEVWRPEGRKKLGNYWFSVPCAWVERWDYAPENGFAGRTRIELMLCLRADTWRFWEPCYIDSRMVLDRTITDSEGVRYTRGGENDRDPRCSVERGSFSTWYRVELRRESPEDIPDWVDIPVGYGGDSIRVDLRNEVIS